MSIGEPVLTVDTREELVYLLGQACEIEHGLMCEYLYAQFSLKRGLDEGLTEGQLARVQAWEAALIGVIKQEMLHLALATNILTALGAAPHFERTAFKVARIYATLAPDGLTANLKLTSDEQELKCTVAAEAFAPVPNAWGRQGWTTAKLSALSTPDLAAALEMAWRHALPSKRDRK